MAGSIGSYNFVTLKGAVNLGSGENLEAITRANVDGVAYRKTGKRGEPFEMISAVDLTSYSSAATTYENYKALQGTLQTLTIEGGTIYTNMAILNVVEVARQPIITSSGGQNANSTVLLECRWLLQSTNYN